MPPRQYPSVSAASALSIAIAADLEALRNDVESAQELAAAYQRQLAGKSNELADLKQIFERTQNDLLALQNSIKELREERHRLANEAMRAIAFEKKLADVTDERDALRHEVLELRGRVPVSQETSRHHRVLEELESLRRELTEARQRSAMPAPAEPQIPIDTPSRELLEAPFDEALVFRSTITEPSPPPIRRRLPPPV